MELQGDADAGRTVFGPEGGLVLQGSAAREEGVMEVVIEQTADGGHVDVSEAWQAAWEVGGVVVRPEETPKLTVEDVLRLRPAMKTQDEARHLRDMINDQNCSMPR